MQYFFHRHAQLRMAPVGIVESDVLAVIAQPAKGPEAGDSGRVNVWGYGANGVRIRVTFNPVSGEIRTVAIADRRFPS